MIDFEDTFEGLTISGRAKLSARPKAKMSVKRPANKSKPTMAYLTGAFRSQVKKPVQKPANKPVNMPAPQVKAKTNGGLLVKSTAKITPVTLAISSAKKAGVKVITPARLQAAAKVIQDRTKLAANIATTSVTRLASKAPVLPSQFQSTIRAKALEAITPVAQACKCEPKPVIKRLDRNMAAKGYPTNTATNVLAGIHDMNESLEKAAIQRLATHEHKKLSTEERFRCKVLRKLSTLSKCLPECHPARTRAHLNILKQV